MITKKMLVADQREHPPFGSYAPRSGGPADPIRGPERFASIAIPTLAIAGGASPQWLQGP